MKKKILVFAVIFACFSCFNSYARENFVTEGRGKTMEEAESQALREMSLTFTAEIQSSTSARQNFESSAGGKVSSMREMETKTLVTSDMQFFGVSFESAKIGDIFTVRATIDCKKSIPLYEKEISSIVKKIDARAASLKGLSGSKEESEWNFLAADYATFDKLERVLSILGSENKNQPKLSSSDFRIKFEQRAKEITSIEKAAEAIAKNITAGIKNSRIYVYPAVFEGDGTTTDFSVALANAVKAKLSKKVALTKISSDSSLKGSYYFGPGTADGEDIIVTYYLCDNKGDVVSASGMIKIPYKVYGQYRYRPRNYDLQKEIASGRVSNPAFDVSIRINGERNALSFRQGDPLTVEVRATSACYIYIIGHVYNDEGEPFSYLFPLEPYADGKEMFCKKISPKEANVWVVINPTVDDEVMSLEVIPPFGEETLQVFASTTTDFDDFASQIPSYAETDDFFVVSGSPVETVAKTRALNIKRVSNKAKQVVNKAENSVTYSTRK